MNSAFFKPKSEIFQIVNQELKFFLGHTSLKQKKLFQCTFNSSFLGWQYLCRQYFSKNAIKLSNYNIVLPNLHVVFMVRSKKILLKKTTTSLYHGLILALEPLQAWAIVSLCKSAINSIILAIREIARCCLGLCSHTARQMLQSEGLQSDLLGGQTSSGQNSGRRPDPNPG
jgi:hypothetical protein